MVGKYRNKGCQRVDEKHGTVKFDSMLEAAVFDMLRNREVLGEIEIQAFQKTVYLTRARIQYISDFECFNNNTKQVFYVEAKGLETPVWRIKRKLWSKYGAGVLQVWKGSHKYVFLHETLITDAA